MTDAWAQYAMRCPACQGGQAHTVLPDRVSSEPDRPGYDFAQYHCDRTKTHWVKPWRQGRGK